MKITTRLYLAISACGFAGIAIALWIAFSAFSSAERTKDAVDQAFEGLRYAVEFKNLMSTAHDNLENLLRMENAAAVPEIVAEHQRIVKVLGYVSAQIDTHSVSPALIEAVAKLQAEQKAWEADAAVLFGLTVSNEVPTVEVMDRHRNALERYMADVLRIKNIAATEASTRIKDQLVNSLVTAGSIGAILMAIAGALAFTTVRKVSRGLLSLGGDMTRLAEGNMDIDRSLADRTDEIGDMAKSVGFFRQALEDRAALEARRKEEAETQRRLADQQRMLIDRLEKIVAAGVAGDFSASMDCSDLDGPQLQLAGSVNTLLDAVGSGLAAISLVMSDLADANLSSRMEGEFSGSFATLRNDVNTTCETLASLIHKVQAMVHNIDEGTLNLAKNGRDLTSRSQEQTGSIGTTVQTVEAIVARVSQSRELGDGAVKRASEAESRAEHGQSVVSESVAAIREIERASEKITDIISVIESIAFQTNLLALNAAVEAARAGESGKGFAVVATEVRTLAQRTTEAAHDISQLIRDSSDKVEQGVVLAEATGTALEEIKDSIQTMARDVRSISQESTQLAAEAKDVRSAMTDLETLNRQSAEIVAQSSETTNDFEQMTRELSSAVAQFKVEGGEPVVVERDPEHDDVARSA